MLGAGRTWRLSVALTLSPGLSRRCRAGSGKKKNFAHTPGARVSLSMRVKTFATATLQAYRPICHGVLTVRGSVGCPVLDGSTRAAGIGWRRREGAGESRSPVRRQTNPARRLPTRATPCGSAAPLRHATRAEGRSMDRSPPCRVANRFSRPRYPGDPVSLLRRASRPLPDMSGHVSPPLDPTRESWRVPLPALRERSDAHRRRPRPDLPVLGELRNRHEEAADHVTASPLGCSAHRQLAIALTARRTASSPRGVGLLRPR